jgi:hypothetical protein
MVDFLFDIVRNSRGQPSAVTIRIVRTVNNLDRVFTMEQMQRFLARELVRLISIEFPNWSADRILDQVTGFIF